MKKCRILLVVIFSACAGSKKAAQTTSTDSPPCINQLINKFTTEEKQNPPRSIYRYTFNNATVYYVPAPCCDFFSDLYDSNCNLIGHPDGGFTGKGDGKIIKFDSLRTEEKLIWRDER